MKKLIYNFFYIGLSRIVDFGVPLIIFPYLVSVVGKYNYGKYVFAYSLIVYFLNIVQYGFSLSAVRDVAENRNDKEAINNIFNKVITTQLFLILFSFIIISTIVLSVPKFRNEWIIYFSLFIMIIGDTMLCFWYYRGIDKMKFITFINFISKISYFLFALLLIKEANDYILIGFCQSIGFIISGVISLYLLYKKENIRIKLVGFRDVYETIKSGISSFVSLAIPTLYSNTSMFLLGLFGSPIGLTYFDGASKISRGFISIDKILTQVFYPYLVGKSSKSKFEKVSRLYFIIGLALTIIMFFAAPFVGPILIPNSDEIILLIRILSISPFLLAIKTAYGVNYLMVHHHDKKYMNYTIVSSLIGILIAFILIPWLDYIGAALVIVLSRFIYMGLCYLGVKKIEYEKNH